MDTHTTHALDSQVGGHPGVMTTEDGSLIIKPALPRELAFYEALQSTAALAALRAFTPKFLGVLQLQGQLDPAERDAAAGLMKLQPAEADQKESIVLENLSFAFAKPNILDVKLGTVLYDEDAPPEKVARMEKTARDTTSFETGIRLTGFQVHDNITSEPVITPKSYGKTIKPAELAEGIARFFPIGNVVPPFLRNVMSSQGLPRDTLILILRAMRAEIAAIREILASVELRMVGGSLLIIYEADWERAAEAIKKYIEGQQEEIIAKKQEEEEIAAEKEEEEEDEEEDEEDDDDEDEDDSGSDGPPKLGPPFIVKLIDFAHTRLKPGEGPDEGVLRGVDTVLRLLDERLESILASPPSPVPAT